MGGMLKALHCGGYVSFHPGKLYGFNAGPEHPANGTDFLFLIIRHEDGTFLRI